MSSFSGKKAVLSLWVLLFALLIESQADTLLLRNKSLIEGDVRRTGKEYIVQSPQGGTVYVPVYKVLKHCESRQQAYRWQLGRIRSRDVKQHVQLAQWCIQNGMLHEATDRLLYLNRFAATNRSVRLLEKQLVANSTKKKSKFRTASLSLPRKTSTAKREVRKTNIDIGSMKPETVSQFRRVVQPLLVNRCGQASCHGSASTNEFQLVTLRRSSLSREHTIENLQRISSFIDFDEPAASILLDYASAAHGPSKSAPIHVKNIGKLKRVEDWVFQLAGKDPSADQRTPEAPSYAPQPTTNSTSAPQGKAGETDSSKSGSPIERFATKPGQKRLPPVQDDQPAAPKANRADPFDPSVFNNNTSSGK